MVCQWSRYKVIGPREASVHLNLSADLTVTMESSKLWTTAMAYAVLFSCIQGAEMDVDNESDLETRALREFYPKDPNLTNEKQLVSIA